MADKEGKRVAEFAFMNTADPKKPLSAAQKEYIRRADLERLRNHSQKLRGRNVATGLLIGAFVMGIFGYTIYSVSQERIMDELDDEARFAMSRGPRTGAN
ncbi:cytochrome c oxidase assembly factor 3 homolog, mitochondrial [Anguilla rostrata]|uniref:Cytochrome c oxidase assembly factor 3 n=1 Tax=Anguilla anguilla TaxID=7936 RepID=A0A9D3RJ79_ANGAN|nr:cytochrome c oxidase assembly factor 3 homolog, mitochondrial [Anguilla anguilla]KAG5832065.1 hypothetical protein ANANG_G00287160 [Anguilla anguilla]